jgi:hypothetical protein
MDDRDRAILADDNPTRGLDLCLFRLHGGASWQNIGRMSGS